MGQIAAVFTHLLRRQFTDIRQPFSDEPDRELIHFREIIGRIIKTVIPRKTQPRDIFLDRVDILGILFCGVRVIHTQIAQTVKLFRHSKVYTNRLCMADVQVTVRLRRETCVYTLAGKPPVFRDVLLNKRLNEIAALLLRGILLHRIHLSSSSLCRRFEFLEPQLQAAQRFLFPQKR